MSFEKLELPDQSTDINSGLLRSRVLALLMPILPLTGCQQDGTNVREIAIVAPENLLDEASKICLTDESGQEICDPEWRDEVVLEEFCITDSKGDIVDCKPEQIIKGAWIYSIPFTPEEFECWDFKDVPMGYFAVQEEDGELLPHEGFCFSEKLFYKGEGKKPDYVNVVDSDNDVFYLKPQEQFPSPSSE